MSKIFSSKKKEVSKTEIDPAVYNRVLSNLQFAEDVAAIPYQPYRGLMVAPFTRDYMAGEAMTRRIAQEGGYVPEVEAAARAAQQALGFQPERVGAERIGAALAGGPERVSVGQVAGPAAIADITAGRVGTTFAPERVGAGRVGTTFAARDIVAPGAAPTAQAASFLGRDIGQYMNPYQQGVIDVGLEDIGRAEELARQQRSQRATAARAFGGSRAAIEEGIAAGEAARERNRYIAEQRAQGFREAAALREADVAREQQASIANLDAAQRVMELAQQGAISNQQRDIELSRLGLTAEQANVEAAMRADLANQQALQEAQRMGLTAEQANVQAQLEAARANQGTALQREELAARTGQFNVQAGLEGARANQQAIENYMRMGLSAEEANQRAMLEAGRANQAAGLEAAQFRLGAGRNLADYGQMALQNRYGAASALTGIGTAQQNLYQQYLNAQREEEFRRQQYPLQQLAIRQGAVSASPYNVTQTGTVTSTPSYWQMAGQVAGTVAAFSDENMKKNISKINNPLDKVNRLKGIEFEWEDEYKDDVEENGQESEGKDMSVSAQDVNKVMPEAVQRGKHGMMMVKMPQLIGLLTEAVKELDAKVEGKSKKRMK